MSIRDVTLGYLFVLNDPFANAALSQTERDIGMRNIMGSLCNLVGFLEKHPSSENLFVADTIKLREYVNGQKPVGDPELVAHTQGCAAAVLEFYKGL